MTQQKTPHVLWSKTAVDAAGPNLAELTAKLRRDVSGFLIDSAKGAVPPEGRSFLHVIGKLSDGRCYNCNGHEDEDEWRIFVQIAQYKPMAALCDDHHHPEMRGKVLKFPEVIQEPDNEMFAA